MPVRLRAALALSLTVILSAVLLVSAAAAPVTEDAKSSTPARALAGEPERLLPNARALKANNLIVRRDADGHRLLRFESGLANVGRGPLEVRPNHAQPCPTGKQHASQIIYRDTDGSGFFSRKKDIDTTRRSAGCMVFHPSHDHWHFEAAARYTLYKPTQSQPILVTHRKLSFCLRDSERAPERWPTADYPQFYGDCAKHDPQGISIGWADIYQNYLPGQLIRLPDGLRAGLYCLRTVVDPQDQLAEIDDEDKSSLRAFRLSGLHVSIRPETRCR